MAKPETTEVRAWSPRDRTLSVYVDELLELTIEELRNSIPLRSKAEVGRQAIELGLPRMPGYAEAVRAAERRIGEREAAASRDAAV
jgi:predicted DNA-binding protein